MNFVGVIAEYDPLHNGHAAQLQMLKAQGAGCIAVVLSAGAVQRGGVPVLPESVRVRAALAAGADLVVAQPAPYACSGAESFAAAGVRLAAALGCDTLAFGAETPDADALLQTAKLLQTPDLQQKLRANLATGQTYAAARAAAAEALRPGSGALLRSPNNILGVEYCKAILAQGTALTPLPLPRLGAQHGGGAGEWQGTPMASASHLRSLPFAQLRPFVPPEAWALYEQAKAQGLWADPAKFETALLALLRMQDPANFARVRGISEGLEHRLAAAVRTAPDLAALYDAMKTKRYPHARLRRLAWDAALGVYGEVPPVPYLHLLGAKRSALPRCKQAALPVGTSLADLVKTGPEAAFVGSLHSRAVDFSALCREKTLPMGLAFTTKPVVL